MEAIRVEPQGQEHQPAHTGRGAVERVVRFVHAGLAGGELVPGQRLVEPELAERTGVSRASVREAFRALAAEGLISIERYKGASVRRLQPQELRESFDIRELLEGLAARRAAEHACRPPYLARFRELMREMERAASLDDEGAAYGRLNRDFHDLILEAAASEQLSALANHIRPPAIVRLLHQRLLEPGAMRKSLAEHQAIAAALLAGDGPRAEASMRRHIRSSMQSMPGVAE